jgi:hypothetical protein
VKAGKKGRQAILHNSACLPFAFYNASFFWHRDILDGFFQRAGKATAKGNNIKEDVQ